MSTEKQHSKSRYTYGPQQNGLPDDEKVALFRSLQELYGCECTTNEELEAVLRNKADPVAYDGFEPSGRMHIAQGLLKRNIVNRFTQSGFTYIFWIADWFAFLNHKLGGDLEKIKLVGRYMIEIWTAAGMDMSRVRFLWASEEFAARGAEYWASTLDISTNTTLARIKRCTQIMGRKETDLLSASQIFYPCMQCADIFFLGVDVCQLGLDQRKVNMLARDYADTKKIPKPVIFSHPMLPGLKKGQEKMSKSIPDTAVFMEDAAADVVRKIDTSYCPPGDQYQKELLAILKTKAGITPQNNQKQQQQQQQQQKQKQQQKKQQQKGAKNQETESEKTPEKEQKEAEKEQKEPEKEKKETNDKEQQLAGLSEEEQIQKLSASLDQFELRAAQATANPVLAYYRLIIFDSLNANEKLEINIEGQEASRTFDNFSSLEEAYKKGELHPKDMKNNLSRYLNKLLEPVRKHFSENAEARTLRETVLSFTQ